MANQLKMAMVNAILTLKKRGWSMRRIASCNSTGQGSNGEGGGIFSTGGFISIMRSMITGNDSGYVGGGISGWILTTVMGLLKIV